MHRFHPTVVAGLALFLAACGAGAGESPATGGTCSQRLAPGEDDQVAVQSALLGAGPGSVVCFESGTYRLSDGLSLSAPGVTLRAEGGQATFDFSHQTSPAAGLDVTGDDFTLSGISFRQPRGPGLRILGVDNVRLSRVEASLSRRQADEGAAGIVILGASNLLIEDCEVSGGQTGLSIASSFQAVVSGCTFQGNRVGVSVQRSSDVELVGNTIRSNDDGLHLRGSPSQPTERIKIHDNLIENSRAQRRQLSAGVVGGAGLLVAGASNLEIHDNVIRRNDTAGLLLGGPTIAGHLGEEFGEGIHGPVYIHGNHVEWNGRRPTEFVRELLGGRSADTAFEPGEEGHLPCFSGNEGSFLAANGESEPPTGGCPAPTLAPISL